MAKIKRICDVKDCGKPHHSKGYCREHYPRWKRHGDPLAGNASHGEPEHFLREVVLVYDGEECLLWPYSKGGKGYGSINLGGRMKTVSRVVCEFFNGPPPSPEYEAAHLCGRGHDACVTKRHLVWKTPAENSADKTRHGTQTRGERHGTAKLTREQVLEIQSLRGVASQSELAARFGVSQSTVSLVQRGKNWAWLTAKSEPA